MAKDVIKTKPEIIFADVTDERTVELSWKEVKEATGYNIERYDREKDKFVKIGSVDAGTTAFTCKKEPKDGVYQYRINALKAIEGKLRPLSKKGSPREVNISSIPAVNVTKISSPEFGKVSVSWEKDENAVGYVINRRLEEMNESVVRGETDSESLSFIDDTAVSGQVYYYNVQSFILDENGERVFSNTGKEECFVCVDSTEILEVKRKHFKKVSISYRLTCGISFYVLLKSEKKDGEFTEISRSKSGTALTLSDKAKSGEKGAYYCVRCCKIVNSKEWYSDPGKAVYVKYKL